MEYRLYIVIRSDEIRTLRNGGCCGAQSSHATSEFEQWYQNSGDTTLLTDEAVDNWRGTRKFGTTIILSGTLEDFNELALRLQSWNDRTVNLHYGYGYVVDEEFQVPDGNIVHTVPDVITAFWYFVPVEFQEDRLKIINDSVKDYRELSLYK